MHQGYFLPKEACHKGWKCRVGLGHRSHHTTRFVAEAHPPAYSWRLVAHRLNRPAKKSRNTHIFVAMIRPAKPEDAKQAAPLFILSMGHIAGIFANSARHEDAIPFFEHFFRLTGNQYSHVHTLVFENNTQILGSVTGYDGALLQQLRRPVLDELQKTQPYFTPADETEAGEYYLDCIHVDPTYQGRGIGKMLIGAFCERAEKLGFSRVGLIVDKGNPAAKVFYEKLNFKVAGEKDFMGHSYFHMLREV